MVESKRCLHLPSHLRSYSIERVSSTYEFMVHQNCVFKVFLICNSNTNNLVKYSE